MDKKETSRAVLHPNFVYCTKSVDGQFSCVFKLKNSRLRQFQTLRSLESWLYINNLPDLPFTITHSTSIEMPLMQVERNLRSITTITGCTLIFILILVGYLTQSTLHN